ncbi:metal-dependent transcriptional regulator, partial [bacterium]|nr:metal-dependent transcriptional regulator [bacterium]
MKKEKNKETGMLSHCLEDYLEGIYIINIDKKVVRVKELAEFLKVKTPSVVDAVSKLEKKGLVNHEKYGYLSLSKEGLHIAKGIYNKHEY